MRFLLLLPLVFFFGLFTLWPLVEVVSLSMFRTNFIKSVFVGLDNYIQAFSDPDFIQSILNSLCYSAILVPGQLLVALFFAAILYDMHSKWQSAARILFYIPVLSSGIIIAASWKWIFNSNGLLNWFIGKEISWFGQAETAIPVISFIVVFASFGINTMMLLSSMISIEKSLFDSARIDGANNWQILRRIVFPIISPTIIMILFVSIIGGFQIFENIYMLVPQTYAATVTYFIYQQGFEFSRYGLASAESIILLAIIGILYLAKKKALG